MYKMKLSQGIYNMSVIFRCVLHELPVHLQFINCSFCSTLIPVKAAIFKKRVERQPRNNHFYFNRQHNTRYNSNLHCEIISAIGYKSFLNSLCCITYAIQTYLRLSRLHTFLRHQQKDACRDLHIDVIQVQFCPRGYT